jgi:two-component system sensor histidine kinase KdpD
MTDDERPSPTDLLARYGSAMRKEAHVRGRLRIYLGAAPGVGKTYAMLQEGHRLKRLGQDVAIGIVETHGRAETAAQLGDLELIPTKRSTYRGVETEELDTAAIIRRAPGVVLVDELAHTNVPGSPREKRWQDVEAIRDAGIDVIATLNIQHLESLNDVVSSITGIAVRETIPDRILDHATEIQLVDLPVDGLLERMEQGKIYPPARAEQAMRNFFRAGNLTALRELALRRTAAGVDDRLETYMHEHGIDAVWPATERIGVIVTADETIGKVIRRAWRVAEALRAELLAIAVLPPGGHSDSKGLHLAEDLGAIVHRLETDDPVAAIADLVNAENISTLVLGHRAHTGWRLPWKRSLHDDLLVRLENVAIQLVEL